MNKNTILKDFMKFVSLNVLGMLGLSCYILADTLFIAKAMGALGLASLNFSISVFSILQGFGLMIGIGGATRFVILKSQKDHDGANSIFSHSLVLGAMIATIFVIIALFFTNLLATLLGADENTLPFTQIYLTTILIFSPCFLLNNILLAFIRNDNNPKLSMIAMLFSSFSNIILDYIFIFPLSMGMFGAAFATGLSSIISVTVLSFHFVLKKNNFHISKCKIYRSKMMDIISLGFSSFIGELASAISLIIFNLIILQISGNIGVAAYGIIANIALIVVAIFTGIAQGIQPLASKGFGHNDKDLLSKLLTYTIITVFSISTIIYVIVCWDAEKIVFLFNKDANHTLEELAVSGMKIYFLGYFFAGFNIVVPAFLSAVSKPKLAFFISILRSCIIIVPLVILCSIILKMDGVWISFIITESLVFGVSIFSLRINQAPLPAPLRKKINVG